MATQCLVQGFGGHKVESVNRAPGFGGFCLGMEPGARRKSECCDQLLCLLLLHTKEDYNSAHHNGETGTCLEQIKGRSWFGERLNHYRSFLLQKPLSVPCLPLLRVPMYKETGLRIKGV